MKEILDISYESFKKQYKSLAKQNHPDKGGETTKMQIINEAKTNLESFFQKDKLNDQEIEQARYSLEVLGLIKNNKARIFDAFDDDSSIDYSEVLKNVTNIQTRQSIENRNRIYMKRNIIFPEILYNATKEMVNYQNEIVGIILARKQLTQGKIFYIVEFMEIIGKGNRYNVKIDKRKKNSILELINRNPELIPIEFHTHTVGTGKHWDDKFSNGDYEIIGKMLSINPEYMHVLFTPQNILTVAKSKMAFNLGDTNTEIGNKIIERFKEIKNEYESILRNI